MIFCYIYECHILLMVLFDQSLLKYSLMEMCNLLSSRAAQGLFCPSEQRWCQTCNAVSSIQLGNAVQFVSRQPLLNMQMPSSFFFPHVWFNNIHTKPSKCSVKWKKKKFGVPELPVPHRLFFKIKSSVHIGNRKQTWFSRTPSFHRRVKLLMSNALQPVIVNTSVLLMGFFFMFLYVFSVNLFFPFFIYLHLKKCFNVSQDDTSLTAGIYSDTLRAT